MLQDLLTIERPRGRDNYGETRAGAEVRGENEACLPDGDDGWGAREIRVVDVYSAWYGTVLRTGV